MIECPCILPGTQLRALVKPPDADELWQWYESLGNLEADPSWAEVWPTAAALAEAMVAAPDLVADKDVAELGSGLGLVGLASISLGARSVLFLDREPHALHCAMASASLNGFPTTPTLGGAGVGAALIDWSETKPEAGDDDESSNNTGDGGGGGRKLAAFAGNFDVVVASDVLYDDATVLELADSAVLLLRGQKQNSLGSDGKGSVNGGAPPAVRGLLLVTDPETERSPGCRDSFVAALKEKGATVVEVIPLPPVASTTAASSSYSPVGRPERTVLIRALWDLQ